MLSSEDRAVIAACVRRRAVGERISLAQIGELIGRDRSVISREIVRNSGPDGSYHGAMAHRVAQEKRRRPKEFRLRENPALCRRIEDWMDDGWSPRLIATVLKNEYPHMIMERVSHETIYQALYVQGRGSLRKDLYRALSTKRPRREPRTGARRANSPYREAFTISQRPRRSPTGPYRDIGKATWSSGPGGPPRSGPWSNARPGSRSCSTSRVATTPNRLPRR